MEIEKLLSQMSLEEKASLCSGADFWHTQAIERLNVPAVMMTDGPQGLRKQTAVADHLGIGESNKAVCFPTGSALAASFDRELMCSIGETLGRECQAENVGVLLGPAVNIKRSPLCGRNFEYLSEDPYLSGEMAAAYIEGLQGQGIACSIKHFLANNLETGRMSSDSVIDERTLHEIYLTGFEKPIRSAKAKTVMCAYNKVNGTFMAENCEMLTNILREKWGFDGAVVTDWGAAKDAVSGLTAGLDLAMPGGSPQYAARIVEAIKSGELEEEKLNQAVEHILSVVTFIKERQRTGVALDLDADHERACAAAKECAVLLKNDRGILPLQRDSDIAVIGTFAKVPRYQGNGSSFINSHKVESSWECFTNKEHLSYAPGYNLETDEADEALIQEAVDNAKCADAAVIFAGLPNDYESEGFDRKHINLPPAQNELIKRVAEVQPNTVVVLHIGANVTMPWVENVPAILNMYLGGEGVGRAVVDLLFGDAVPGGKLAESFPIKLEDNPSYLNFPGYEDRVEYREGLYVGYRYYDTKKMEVLFPFGHGLSYTTFSYSNLRLDVHQAADTDTVQVQVDVTNTGEYHGKEVVQLYVKPCDGTVPRPVHELKGFCKIFLQPKETKTVTFTLDKRAFAHYNVTIHDWYVEELCYEVQIGSSSRDIRLTDTVKIIPSVALPVHFTQYSTIAQVLKSPKGAMIFGSLMASNQAAQASVQSMGNALGESTGTISQTMMMETPLQSLTSFGIMDTASLQQLVDALNAQE